MRQRRRCRYSQMSCAGRGGGGRGREGGEDCCLESSLLVSGQQVRLLVTICGSRAFAGTAKLLITVQCCLALPWVICQHGCWGHQCHMMLTVSVPVGSCCSVLWLGPVPGDNSPAMRLYRHTQTISARCC
jgi:hypothetical protein